MNKGIKFGTAGFRGIIGDDWTRENIQRVGNAFRKMLEARGKSVNIVIGYDNRFMGRTFAQWFCEAACCSKIRATLFDIPTSTPTIAFKTVSADYGIMITASHNPYFYNGIKILLKGGRDAGEDVTNEIEQIIAQNNNISITKFDQLLKTGEVKTASETGDYVDAVLKMIDPDKIRKSGIKVLLNPMHGSGSNVAKTILTKTGVSFDIINENADPYFGGKLPSPYPHNLVEMQKQVVLGKYNLGIALDGDADRLSVIDEKGTFHDCNYLGAALYYYLLQYKKQRGSAVKSFITSNLLVRIAKKYGFEVHQARVGFKFLAVAMQNSDAIIAVENGGTGFRQLSYTKDGIASAMMIIDMLANLGQPISAIIKNLCDEVQFPSVWVEYAYPFSAEMREGILKKLGSPKKPDVGKIREVVNIDTFPDGYKIRLTGDYWCAARLSGTENVLRLQTEMPDNKSVEQVFKILEQFYGLSERQK